MSRAKRFIVDMKNGFLDFGLSVTTVVNFILLSFVYIFGVGITSIIAKISGKRFLDSGIDKKANSYYKSEIMKKKKMEEYYRQF